MKANKGFPAFEQQIDGSYRNREDSLIVKNGEDSTWFIMGSPHGTIVSFDQAGCPEQNQKWHLLNLDNMQYSDYDLKFR